MILAPAEEHSIFFQAAQSRGCLTRIEYACRGTLDGLYTTGRNGGDTRKMSQEIERDTFRAQQGTSRAFKVSQDLVRMDSISILHQQVYDNTLIEQLKRRGCNRESGDDAVLARDETGVSKMFLWNSAQGGDIVFRTVLFEGTLNKVQRRLTHEQ